MQRNNSETKRLANRKIAFFITDGFNEIQLFSPKIALENAGAKVVLISLNKGEIKSWDIDHWGNNVRVDATFDDIAAEDFDALIIPGGKINLEILSQNKKIVHFIKELLNDGKMIASICDGTQFLISSGLTKGSTFTTKLSLKKDLLKSGAKWKDEEVVVHKGFISSRCPADNPIFNKIIIESVSMGPQTRMN